MKPKRNRWRLGRQRERRVLEAQTDDDLRMLARFEADVLAVRVQQAKRTTDVLQVCVLGSEIIVHALV